MLLVRLLFVINPFILITNFRTDLLSNGTKIITFNMIDDFNIMRFQQKMPNKYRQKQNVSIDGTLTNQIQIYLFNVTTPVFSSALINW